MPRPQHFGRIWQRRFILKMDQMFAIQTTLEEFKMYQSPAILYWCWKNTHSILACMWRHHFLKSKTKEPPKFLTSSGIRWSKLTSVYNFSAQYSASSGNQRILNFRVMAVRDIKLRPRLSNIIFLSRYCKAIQRSKEKRLCTDLYRLVQTWISRLDNRSKLQGRVVQRPIKLTRD